MTGEACAQRRDRQAGRETQRSRPVGRRERERERDKSGGSQRTWDTTSWHRTRPAKTRERNIPDQLPAGRQDQRTRRHKLGDRPCVETNCETRPGKWTRHPMPQKTKVCKNLKLQFGTSTLLKRCLPRKDQVEKPPMQKPVEKQPFFHHRSEDLSPSVSSDFKKFRPPE